MKWELNLAWCIHWAKCARMANALRPGERTRLRESQNWDFEASHHITASKPRSSVCEFFEYFYGNMVPSQAPPSPVLITQPALPPLTRGSTLPVLSQNRSFATDRTLLAPEDAIHLGSSPPRKQSSAVNKLQKDLREANGVIDDVIRGRAGRHKNRNASSTRRRKATWRKLLWVKQSCKLSYSDT